MTDRYKKPNHPTFSNESKYHGVNGWEGGIWEQNGSRWRFHAGKGNLILRTPDDLRDYFKRVEKDTDLVLPGTGTELQQAARLSRAPELDQIARQEQTPLPRRRPKDAPQPLVYK